MSIKDFSELVKLLNTVSKENYFVILLLYVITAGLAIGAVVNLLKLLVKLFDYLKSAWGYLSERFSGEKSFREHIERRRQFLTVLGSDLATIGKSEAWNDQNFTDLEAEVEIEGGYYASLLDRLRKKRSFSLRKEPSLIGAIDGSAERCLLLTGDPGAGKSVALRHLAVQMIERAKKSKRKYCPIPLYVNLRDLSADGVSDSTAFKKFVIDNVRRGDADTAEYVQAHWADFNLKGGWFFLFDSFDEIPEVLHAANEDAEVGRYGAVIQRFMDGLGACRGVLASREYKSPKALAWPKLRILPLNEKLQDQLIARTFLSDNQKGVALRAISASASSTYKNPLFLTLLCRYVKENSAPPKNEHELLLRHVDSLASRDSEYIASRWGLKPPELIDLASELAKLFALSPEIGLSPTIDQINQQAKKLGVFKDGVNFAIEALTYVKIGRTDLASSSSSERRFAFSHRRYHEAIFARFLAKNEGFIDARSILSNPRWREYVVAMLQSAHIESQASLIDAAKNIVSERISLIRLSEEKISGYTVKTYSWNDEILEHLLQIFVDVKKFNPSPLWLPVEDEVEQLFEKLWVRGDLYDRAMIIRFGGAGNAEKHSRRLDYSFRLGVEVIQEEAVSSCQFATKPSDELANWVRKRVAMSVLMAPAKFDALKWETIGSQLPLAYEMEFSLARARSLRKISEGLRMFRRIFDIIEPNFFGKGFKKGRNVIAEGNFKVKLIFSCMMPLAIFMVTIIGASESLSADAPKAVSIGAFIFSSLLLASLFFRIHLISRKNTISLRDVLAVSRLFLGVLGLSVMLSALMFFILAIPGLIVLWVSRTLDLLSGISSESIVITSSVVVMILIVALVPLVDHLHSKKLKEQAKALLTSRKSLRSAISSMKPGGDVSSLCEIFVAGYHLDQVDLRRSITLISEKILRRHQSKLAEPANERFSDLRHAVSTLLQRALKEFKS